MQRTCKGITIETVVGDITRQADIQAIVNAANAQLRTGGGVAGAIHRAAGPELEKECRRYAPISPGEAVISKAYNLPNQFVIHCLGPVYGIDQPEDKLLSDCYVNALKLADKEGIESIAFPAISTGVFSYPVSEAAEISLKAIRESVDQLKHVKLIRLVFFNAAGNKASEEILAEWSCMD